MTRLKARTCRKVRFRDHREAVAALHNVALLRKRAEEEALLTRRHEVRSYKCEACRGFHLTSLVA